MATLPTAGIAGKYLTFVLAGEEYGLPVGHAEHRVVNQHFANFTNEIAQISPAAPIVAERRDPGPVRRADRRQDVERLAGEGEARNAVDVHLATV